MILEIVIGGLILSGLIAYFWEDLKAWATALFEYLVEDILAEYVVDAITGGLVTLIRIGGGFLRRARYLKRVYAYFRQGRQQYSVTRDEEITQSELPAEVLDLLRSNAELPVIRISV